MATRVAFDGVTFRRVLAVDRRASVGTCVGRRGAVGHASSTAVQHLLQLARIAAAGAAGLEAERHHRAFEHGLTRCQAVEQQMIAVDEHRSARRCDAAARATPYRRRIAPVCAGGVRASRCRRPGRSRRSSSGRPAVRCLRRPQRPRGAECVARHGLAEPAQTPAVGRRYDAGDIVGARLETSRTDEPRDVALGRALHLGRQGLRRARARRIDCDTACECAHSHDSSRSGSSVATSLRSGDRGQRPARAKRRRLDLCTLDNHEHEPRAQVAVRVRVCRRQQPRESRADRSRRSRGSSARSWSTFGRGSVRTTRRGSMPITSAGPYSVRSMLPETAVVILPSCLACSVRPTVTRGRS